jgi:hypothetical protein
MIRCLIIIICLVCFLTPDCFPQANPDDRLLRETVKKDGQAIVSIPIPGRDEINELSRKVSVSSVREKSVEIFLSPKTVEWFILRKFNYTLLESVDAKGIVSAASVTQAMSWDTYPTYTQYDSIMRSFKTLYPSLCTLDTIGSSIWGKYVLVLKISDNVTADEDEPETFYSSTIHGRETGGFILMLHLADYLLKNYSTNTRVKRLVDNLEIWINPLANPDGTYLTGNTITSPTRYNANGVDLNRDFPDPEYDQSPKQKETLDMMKFLRSHYFILSANFHSGEEVVNYPWDRWYRLHADNDWFYHISRKYADTTHLHSAVGYMTFMENGVTNGADWYVIYGGRQDFVTWELQGREVTIELDDNFITPVAQLLPLWEANYRSLIGYLENALYGIHGSVKDAVTGNPVAAKIFITGHDTDSSHIYSDTLTGSFVRLISPGTWDITFTAQGYATKVMNDVVVAEDKKTELNVGMIPMGTIPAEGLKFAPNPSDGTMNIILPERQAGRINVRIFNIMGRKVADYYEDTFTDIPVFLNSGRFAGGTYIITITNTLTRVTDTGRFVVIR